ncbi:hypothetical protein [Dictyobacter arantiisoli]|uniref:hypothetical protein n=1 Tax=Dictyobacter arantiisoli TaxID=2014874 RepID=UPI0011ED9142|nr:hypothetical protein [Dictyobacter arantiisoli]
MRHLCVFAGLNPDGHLIFDQAAHETAFPLCQHLLSATQEGFVHTFHTESLFHHEIPTTVLVAREAYTPGVKHSKWTGLPPAI